MITCKNRLILAAIFTLFLIGGNAEAAEERAPCDYRPFPVCSA